MKRLLLDSHAFLWWVFDDPRLSPLAKSLIQDPDALCLVSHATAWELAIKVSLGRLELTEPVTAFIESETAVNGFALLPVQLAHIAIIERLPFHHRDPFDRMLVAQALAETLPLVSADPALDRYGINRLW
ncbi:MAG: type II toxin-antitoxin system VapC family toxin [Pseudomonadota bacterium]